MRRTHCGACGHGELRVVLDLGMSPVADAYTGTADETTMTYPLKLAVCEGCRLAQLTDVLPQDVLFGTGYSFYTSASPPLSRYHENYADAVIITHGNRGRVVEIGCNDGDMLRHFRDAGWDALGVDPAGGPVKVARERGLDVINEPFGFTVARAIREDNGPAYVVIANHVLAHVESVADVLAGIAQVLAPDGTAYVEVQYLPDLLTNNAIDLIYHEHRNFFSLTTLESAAARWGLVVTNAMLTERQGGSLRVELRHVGVKLRPGIDRVMPIRASESWLRDGDPYGGLQGRADRIRDRLRSLLLVEKSRSCWGHERRLIGYGAPAKATTLLNFCGIDRTWLDAIVDTTPAKQGRFVPGAGIRIVSPDDVALTEHDTALLLAWNYAGTIMRNNLSFTEAGGRWIVPIPAPVII